MEAYIIYNDNTDEPIGVFKKRETAFEWLKQKSDGEYAVKPVPVFGGIEDIKQYKWYTATCNLGDSEINVTETVYFPELERDAPTAECTQVQQYGAKLTCCGTNLDQVAIAIRKFVAHKRYEFETAVRKVCNVVQPKIENNEAMTVNQIVDESGIGQDTVVKILILLKKEGFLDIVDPVEQMKEAQTKGTKTKLWTPEGAVETKNIGVNQRGELVKKDPMKGAQAKFPIKKNNPFKKK